MNQSQGTQTEFPEAIPVITEELNRLLNRVTEILNFDYIQNLLRDFPVIQEQIEKAYDLGDHEDPTE